MLVLSRRVNQTIVIGQNIRITLSAIRGGHVRIAIEAPRDTPIYREELLRGPGKDPGTAHSPSTALP